MILDNMSQLAPVATDQSGVDEPVNIQTATTTNVPAMENGAAADDGDQVSNRNWMDNPLLVNKKTTIARIKHLFLIFLKQFDVDEYKILVKYLRHLLGKYRHESPIKLVEYLLEESAVKTSRASRLAFLPKIVQAESMSKLTNVDENVECCLFLDQDPMSIIKSFCVDETNENQLEPEDDLEDEEDEYEENNSRLKEEDDDEFSSDDDQDGSNLERDYNYFNSLNSNTIDHESSDQSVNEYTYNDDEYASIVDEDSTGEGDYEQKQQPTTTKSHHYRLQQKRRKFSEDIRCELERKFRANNFISGMEKRELAKKLHLTERQVQKWFVHRREKLRKINKMFTSGNDNGELAERPRRGKRKRMESCLLATEIDDVLVSQQQPIDNPTAKCEEILDNNECKSVESNKENVFTNSMKEKSKVVLADSGDDSKTETDENDSGKGSNGSREDPANPKTIDLNSENREIDSESDASKKQTVDITNTGTINASTRRINPRRQMLLEKQQQRQQQELKKQQLLMQQKRNAKVTGQSSSTSLSNGMISHHSHLKQPSAKRMCGVSQHNSNFSTYRRVFPPRIIGHLEKYFNQDAYLKENQLTQLISLTGLNEKQIKAWFKQKRFRLKQELTRTHSLTAKPKISTKYSTTDDYDDQDHDQYDEDNYYGEEFDNSEDFIDYSDENYSYEHVNNVKPQLTESSSSIKQELLEQQSGADNSMRTIARRRKSSQIK